MPGIRAKEQRQSAHVGGHTDRQFDYKWQLLAPPAHCAKRVQKQRPKNMRPETERMLNAKQDQRIFPSTSTRNTAAKSSRPARRENLTNSAVTFSTCAWATTRAKQENKSSEAGK